MARKLSLLFALLMQHDDIKSAEGDQIVRDQVEHLRKRRDDELSQPNLRQSQRKVLTSLQEHSEGLTVG